MKKKFFSSNEIYIDYFLKEEIKEIYKIYSNEMNLESDVDLELISRMSEDMSGADIKSVVCDSFLKAFHRLHSISSSFLSESKI